MSYPNWEQIGKIEKELEKAEHEFRRASEAKSYDGMIKMHNRVCQLVAALSAAMYGSQPKIFAKYYIPPPDAASQAAQQTAAQGASGTQTPAQDSAQQAGAAANTSAPSASASSKSGASAGQTGATGDSAAQAKAAAQANAASAAQPSSTTPSSASAQGAASGSAAGPDTKSSAPSEAAEKSSVAEDDVPDIAVLERQLADLASQMQKCLEAGDMDGMLKANEGMGSLSELMTKAEVRKKEKKKAAALDPLAKITEVSGSFSSPDVAEAPKAKSLSGNWSTGDTMALAKQRAEERKKQQKLNDSFETVVGEVAEKPVEKPKDAPAEAAPGSTVDLLFNDRTMAKIRESTEQPKPAAKPAKPPMTQEQLRDKLEAYNFYQILSVPSTASFEELHKSFFKKIRKLNIKLANKTMEMWQFQEFVASLCLAHDVLKFPNARLQYDLVIFGTEGEANAETTAKAKLMPLKEMLKFSTLINARELADAIEKHKSVKDERELGYYLVEKGLISTEEFDSILFAQKLVSAGKLTVAQFELAMQEMRENSIPLLDTLVASEWIQPQDVFSGDFS